MLAQEVNYIEWRFKLCKSFGSKNIFHDPCALVFACKNGGMMIGENYGRIIIIWTVGSLKEIYQKN